MNKGISFYFGYKIAPEERAKLIHEHGFDTVITNADPKLNSQNGTIRAQMKIFKKYDIKPSSLHMQYNSEDLHYFWEEGREGEKLKKRLIKDVKIAAKYDFTCVVVHLDGKWSEIGKQRLLDVLKVCHKKNKPLAIENIHCQELFVKVFEEIKDDYLRFCYDSGHNNTYDKDFDYLEKYGDKLITLHLHDNDGSSDMHTLNKFGNIDWKKLGEKIAKHKDNLFSLDYEIFMTRTRQDVGIDECLNEVKKQADELENIIENTSK